MGAEGLEPSPPPPSDFTREAQSHETLDVAKKEIIHSKFILFINCLYVFIGNYRRFVMHSIQPIYAVWWFKLATNVVLNLYAYVIYHKMHKKMF